MPVFIEVPATALLVERSLFILATVLFVMAALSYFMNLAGKREWGPFASLLLHGALLVQTAFLVTRGINVNRVPFVGHFEFGNLFIWASTLLYLWMERRLRPVFYAVGAFLTPVVLVYLAYAHSGIVSAEHRELPIVLRFPLWLNTHVSTSVFAYAGFSLAFALGLIWLLRLWLTGGSKFVPKGNVWQTIKRELPAGSVLEENIYTSIAFGFFFQTAMIISGAIWADIAWGRFWGWDPKEMWSLITWFVYAVYLHARLTRQWQGPKVILVVVIGWLAMMFTWIGVAWLLPGIHSFG
ncbi:MAG: Cytochrome c biogenesis protein CcsA [Firmicutes bacterium]|nr:Cytochrome c biogenesis protein CcsA [Bacillota bacterium]